MLNIISLGAGVQSTTMALMAAHGEIEPMPHAAIFADTGDEPQAVYDHLRWLMGPNVLPFSVHITTRGRLSDALRAGVEEARVPFFIGTKGGMKQRQCTRNYKLRPIRRKVRELLGKPGRVHIAPKAVSQWIGISTDEAIRIKPSGVRFIENRHPLIELGMSRHDCLMWLFRNGYPQPPKSSCKYCPYRSRAQWQDMRENQPGEFEEVCTLDDWLGEPEQVARFRGRLYVHPARKPLRDVDLTRPDNQPDLFGNECEGMCGV